MLVVHLCTTITQRLDNLLDQDSGSLVPAGGGRAQCNTAPHVSEQLCAWQCGANREVHVPKQARHHDAGGLDVGEAQIDDVSSKEGRQQAEVRGVVLELEHPVLHGGAAAGADLLAELLAVLLEPLVERHLVEAREVLQLRPVGLLDRLADLDVDLAAQEPQLHATPATRVSETARQSEAAQAACSASQRGILARDVRATTRTVPWPGSRGAPTRS